MDDRDPLKNESFLKGVFGKLFADKGYLSKELVRLVFTDGRKEKEAGRIF